MFCNGNVEKAKKFFEISDEKTIRNRDLAFISFMCGFIFPLFYCIMVVFLFPSGEENMEYFEVLPN
jgi:hypothetical protein